MVLSSQSRFGQPTTIADDTPNRFERLVRKSGYGFWGKCRVNLVARRQPEHHDHDWNSAVHVGGGQVLLQQGLLAENVVSGPGHPLHPHGVPQGGRPVKPRSGARRWPWSRLRCGRV